MSIAGGSAVGGGASSPSPPSPCAHHSANCGRLHIMLHESHWRGCIEPASVAMHMEGAVSCHCSIMIVDGIARLGHEPSVVTAPRKATLAFRPPDVRTEA